MTTGYQRPALKLLESLDLIPKSLIDIGANMGHFVALVHSEWPDVEPVCFEPNTGCKNYLKDYTTHYVGLGNKKDTKTFYVHPYDNTSGGNSFHIENTPFFKDAVEVDVEVDCLDNFNIHADLIKIDTQGAEVEVMQGGKNTIRQAKVVLTEGSFIEYNQGGCLVNDIVKEMDSLGFNLIYTYGPAHGCHWYQGRPVQIDMMFVRKDQPVFKVV